VNTLFEDNRYENHTKKSQISLEGVRLSMLAASTTDTWQRIMGPTFLAIGFNIRIFLVPGRSERKYAVPEKIPEKAKEKLLNRLQELIRPFGTKKRMLEIRTAAHQRYTEWYLGLESSIHSKRLDTYALRLMPLLAVNDGKNCVDEEIVKKVIAICNWQLRVRQQYDPIDADNRMAAMEERIRRQLRSGPKTEHELKQRTNYTRAGIWFFEHAMRNLERNNEIRRVGTKNKMWTLV